MGIAAERGWKGGGSRWLLQWWKVRCAQGGRGLGGVVHGCEGDLTCEGQEEKEKKNKDKKRMRA